MAGLLAVEKLVTIYHAHHFVKEHLPANTKKVHEHVAAG